MNDQKVHHVMKKAAAFLKAHEREERAAEMLLCHHLGMTRAALFSSMQRVLNGDLVDSFMADVYAHAEGVPVQHLIGYEMFFGRAFSVNQNVLIPRPETEELVAAALKKLASRFSGKRHVRVIDVGTGSGAIAGTLALENPQLSVYAVDVSSSALAIAKKNIAELSAPVTFFQGDLLSPIIAQELQAEMIISNPPYVSDTEFENLSPVVKHHEPSVALKGGPDGLDVYRHLIPQLPAALADQAVIALEVGVLQANKVADLLKGILSEKSDISILKDINGKERIVMAECCRKR